MARYLYLTALLLLTAASSVKAASLHLYPQQYRLQQEQAQGYIGFVQATVSSDEQELSLRQLTQVPDAAQDKPAQLYRKLEKSQTRLLRLQGQQQAWQRYLEKWSSPSWRLEGQLQQGALEYLTELEQRRLQGQQQLKDLKRQRQQWRHQLQAITTSNKPAYLPQGFQGSIEVQGRGIPWQLQQEVHLPEDMTSFTGAAQVELVRLLQVRNKTGMELDVPNAYLYLDPLSRYLRLPRFSPLRLHPREKNKARRMQEARTLAASAPARSDSQASPRRLSAVRYDLGPLQLASDNRQVQKELERYTVTAQLQRRVWPYRSSHVYRAIAVHPPFVSQNQNWRVVQGQQVWQQQHARPGNKGRICIPAGVDRQIRVQRDKITEFAEKEGIFNKRRLQRRGYRLEISNRAQTARSLQIIDRLPVSTDERIQVEQVAFTGPRPQQLPEGKLRWQVELGAGETQQLKVTYAIISDPDIQVGQ